MKLTDKYWRIQSKTITRDRETHHYHLLPPLKNSTQPSSQPTLLRGLSRAHGGGGSVWTHTLYDPFQPAECERHFSHHLSDQHLTPLNVRAQHRQNSHTFLGSVQLQRTCCYYYYHNTLFFHLIKHTSKECLIHSNTQYLWMNETRTIISYTHTRTESKRLSQNFISGDYPSNRHLWSRKQTRRPTNPPHLCLQFSQTLVTKKQHFCTWSKSEKTDRPGHKTKAFMFQKLNSETTLWLILMNRTQPFNLSAMTE